MNRLTKLTLFAALLVVGAFFSFAQTTLVPPSLGVMSSTQTNRNTAILSGTLLSTGGENPTVKIVWGDEDRGVTPSPSTAWDNEVTISTNQTTGSFSTTISIPAQGKLYYYRAIASNSAGSTVSRNLGVLLPSILVRSENLQGRWHFDAEDLNDSSGNNRHGTAKKLFSPSEVSNMNLWLDAADASTITHSSNAVSQWSDKSGNSNHATQGTAANQPTLVSDRIEFDGTNDYLLGSNFVLENAHSIFAVAKSDSNGYRRLLNGNTDQYYYFGNGNGSNDFATFYGNGTWTDANTNSPASNVSNTSLLGVISNGTNATPFFNGTALSTKSSNMGGNAPAGLLIGKYVGDLQYWDGEIAEIIIINSDLSTIDREKVEGYLAHKWGLTSSLPSSHTYKSTAPTQTVSNSTFLNDSPFASGRAVNLTNGYITVSTEGDEDTFDGGSAFTVSAWVKGWPGDINGSILSKGTPITNPSSGGWMIGRGTSANDFIANFAGAGGTQTGTHSAPLSTDNSWHHIATTFDGNYRKLFLDGAQVGSTANSGTVTASNGILTLGNSAVKLDEVRFYNTGLSSQEIVDLYGSGKGDISQIGTFSTLPSSISATAGTALSSSVTANIANPYYTAYNLPVGLSINSSTGEISGTPAVGGTHQIKVVAKSTTTDQSVLGNISYSAPSSSPHTD